MKFALKPNDSHKSFYGKCYVEKINGTYYLTSYSTVVASYDTQGNFHRHWNNYSATTMRHVNAFVDFLDIEGGGKAWWDRLPVERDRKLVDEILDYNRKYGVPKGENA